MNRYYITLPSSIKQEIINEMLPNGFDSDSFYGLSTNKKKTSGAQLQSQFFYSGLELMRSFRNVIAHNSRLYAFKTTTQKNLPNSSKYLTNLGTELFSNEEYFNGVGGKDIFALFIWIIICSPDEIVAKSFVDELESFINSLTPDISKTFFQESNIPANTIERLRKLVNSIKY